MRFSLFFELQISNPDAESERRLFHESIEQAVLAEKMGFDGLWVVEHHGLYEYSHSSAPEIFLAYLAAKTNRIRLGHGVNLLPFPYNHPIRVAERIATLDILSNGRVDFGIGKSASLTEMDAFGLTPDLANEQTKEALEIIPRMWNEKIFSHESKNLKILPFQVIPKPIQKPGPPLFAACNRIEAIQEIGESGMGVLASAQGGRADLGKRIEAYRNGIAHAKKFKANVNERYILPVNAMVLDDDFRACEIGFNGNRFFNEALSSYYFSDSKPLGRLKINREALSQTELAELRSSRHVQPENGALFGDVAHAIDAISVLKKAGVDETLLILQQGTVPNKAILESIEIFGRKVIPKFSNSMYN